ncbi:histidine--tRNA ligase [Thamnocephalis sphaerospora]|uniref:histidine--tRNA ligase n=1 Tax=Thamnocephalis sphaerospora TaxID=78915 RepID=A0A4P9XX95_9FUNG|nr:histidine--tRNA ligase [Thamnocephalis sphaerospora]|eukprot:RKP10985.1 histidine--tRNA ligase [Thamnocephalis sphaerospora]
MRDRFAPESSVYRYVTEQARKIAECHGFSEVSTPVLEHASVFERSLGADTDVVGKELYKFVDRGDDMLTLRPEGTAGVVRALLTSQQLDGKPRRLFYNGPMFRRERPQKGRLRQFEQFGVEMLGHNHPTADVELIRMGWSFIQHLGLSKSAQLEINSIGTASDRAQYRLQLHEYLLGVHDRLSADSQRRMHENPLRVLDSKAPEDQHAVQNAPRLLDHLTEDSKNRFAFVCGMLDAVDIPYHVNWRLVRGLDYYNDTVWEIKYMDEQLGASQDTILAGGRYDSLVQTLDGHRTAPAVGWAAGVDRLALLLPSDTCTVSTAPTVAVISVLEQLKADDSAASPLERDAAVHAAAQTVADGIRAAGYRCVQLHHTSGKVQRLGRLLAAADADASATVAVLIGGDEIAAGQVIVRHLASRQQITCTREDMTQVLARILSDHR